MDFKGLIQSFGKIQIKIQSGPTFMEIAKFPKRENVVSNVLAFFFDPKEEHQLDDLLLSSLFELIEAKIPIHNKGEIFVYREFYAEGKRIDIVIEGNDFVVGIENKISASLYNDLETYSRVLDQTANNRACVKIILSLKKEEERNGFTSVTYSDFFSRIEQNLSKYMYTADSKFLLFLLDFMKTIVKPDYMEENKELYTFFEDPNNYTQAKKLLEALGAFEKSFKVSFWSEVVLKLQNLVDENWEVLEIPDIYDSWSMVGIRHKKLYISAYVQGQTLAYHRPYYGFQIDRPGFNFKVLPDEEKLKYRSVADKLLGESKANSGYWIWLKDLDYNFGSEEIFNKIHPSNREEHSKIIAEKLWNVATTIASNADKFPIKLDRTTPN